MVRNLKVLGLALVAVFAMSAMVAAAASATPGVLTTDGGVATTLDITETGAAGANALTAFGEKVECPGTTYAGHEVGSTTKGVPNKATTATVTPSYNNATCNVNNGEHKATVTPNGCDFVFHTGTTTGGVAGTYGVTADVVCPVGKAIEVHVYLSTSNENISVCTLKVTSQAGLTGPHLTNTPGTPPTVPDDVDITGTFTNIKVEREGLCGSSSVENGEFHIDATITGTIAGAKAGVTVSDLV